MISGLNYRFLRTSLTSLTLICAFSSVEAASNSILIPSPPTVNATTYLLEDFNSGRVLAEKEADKKVAPASLTKIMTAYVIYRELAVGHLKLQDPVTISKKAWETQGSKMFVEVGKQVSLEDLLKGMIIQSGNDASVALAEHVGGSESGFATMMNQHAARLGMTNSHFENSMGLPTPNHYTTARDLSKLTHALIAEFPDYYRWDAQKEFTYNKITQQNRNKLLWRDKTVDGVKTGFTDDAGYCMVASAKRENMRLISVVMGTPSPDARANESHALLNYGFHFYETHKVYQGNTSLSEVRVWGGESKLLQLGLTSDLYVTVPRNHYSELKSNITVNQPLMAPVTKGQTYGTINVSLAGQPLLDKPLVALKSIEQGNFIQRTYDKLMLTMEK
jgi:serine-type D-Ala-D-Ala carboxypeptidase (penicillin-binding protein 5/6)